jgi:hypothetical protein
MPKRPPAKIRVTRTRQLYDTTWIPVGEYEVDICCGCGLKHRVVYRWNQRRRRLEERWIVLNRPKFPAPTKRLR